MDVIDCSLSLTTATLKTHTVPCKLESTLHCTHSDHPEQKFKSPPLFFAGRKLRPADIAIEAPVYVHAVMRLFSLV